MWLHNLRRFLMRKKEDHYVVFPYETSERIRVVMRSRPHMGDYYDVLTYEEAEELMQKLRNVLKESKCH